MTDYNGNKVKLDMGTVTDVDTVGLIVYLAGCVVNQTVPEIQETDIPDLDKVYKRASRHMMSEIVATGLEKAGFADQRSSKELGRARHRAILFENSWKEVSEKFEEAGINYLPLKGLVVKQYYPGIGLREMSDHDVLINPSRAEDVKNIMEGLGYTTDQFDKTSHDVYFKEPVLNYEIHKRLFGISCGNAIYEYYRDVNRFFQGEGCRHAFSAEDFYVYMIAHEYKHYITKGTGLRSLLDTYVYLKHVPLDMEYVKGEIQKLGLSDFEELNRSLANNLFSGEKLSDTEAQMLKYVVTSGTYGTKTHRIQNQVNRHGGRAQYIKDRLIAPISKNNPRYDAFAKKFPVFYKYKILLPFLPFYRIINALGSGKLSLETKALKKYTNEKNPLTKSEDT